MIKARSWNGGLLDILSYRSFVMFVYDSSSKSSDILKVLILKVVIGKIWGKMSWTPHANMNRCVLP